MLSVTSSTEAGRLSASRPRMTAVSSMRLLVVSRSPPERSSSLPEAGMAQDEGPAARPGIAAARAVGEELDFGSQWRFWFWSESYS